MNRNESFVRKVIYISAIALLLIPLSWLGQPGISTENVQSRGGTLAQLRAEHRLSQTQLGEIDPAGESMKLATLGLRGVAANILWEKAIDFKKRHDWDNLRATLNQITKLQPNFIKVWEFQAHNLSYNVSVEFDDYRHRYRWIKKGIEFLVVGTRYNSMEPKLFHFTGWIVGQKIGRADEHALFRVLFRDDTEFHEYFADLRRDGHINFDIEDARDYYGKKDNWLAARLWFLEAYDLVDNQGAPLRGKNPVIFFKDSAMSRINYAMAHEEEFDPGEGEIPQLAWETAGEEWREYGSRELPTTWGPFISLNGKEAAEDRIARFRSQLDELAPEARDKLRQEKIDELPERQRATIDKSRIPISDFDVADLAPSAKRRDAKQLARKIAEERERLSQIEEARHNVSYDFWQTRCSAESEEKTTRARKYLFDAHKLHDEVKLDESRYLDKDGKSIEISEHIKPAFATIAAITATGMPCTVHLVNYREFVRDEEHPIYVMQDGAKQKFEKGFDLWADVFDQYPLLVSRTFAEELAPSFRAYRQVLQNLGHEELPSDFVLMALLDFETGFYDLPKSKDLRRLAAQEKEAQEETTKTKTQSDTGNESSDPTPSKKDPAEPDKSKKDDAKKPDVSESEKTGSSSAPKTEKTDAKKTDSTKEEPKKSSTGGASASVQPPRPNSPQSRRAKILRRRR